LAVQVARTTAADGWRATLFVASIPGFILALVIALSVREPVRGVMDGGTRMAEASRIRSSPDARMRPDRLS
jgi:hypothetical protein